MSSTKLPASASRKRFPYPKWITGIIVVFICFRLLLVLPVTQRVLLTLLGQPPDVPLPTVTVPNPIRPENAADVRLLQHWGNGQFWSIAWSPDGRYFGIGTTLGVNLYEAKTFQLLRYIELPIRQIEKLAFSPDGKLLAVYAPGHVLILDLTNDKIVQKWKLEDPVDILTYLENGTLIRVMKPQSGSNHRIILNLVNVQWEQVKLINDDFVTDVAFIPEKQSLLVVYAESVRLVDARNGDETILPFPVHYGAESVFTQDMLLVIDNLDHQEFSAYKDGKLLHRIKIESGMGLPTLSPDGRLLAAVGRGRGNSFSSKAITFWELPSLTPIRTVSIPGVKSNRDGTIQFSPAGDQLAVWVSHSMVRILPVAEGQSKDIEIRDPFAGWRDIVITPEGRLRSFNLALGLIRFPCSAVSSDGSVCALLFGPIGSGDPTKVTIFQRKLPFYKTWTFQGIGKDEFRIAVSPSGNYVAGTDHFHTYLWVDGVKSERQYPPLLHWLAFSPDEKLLASATGILDLETGQVTMTELVGEEMDYSYHERPVFSPDGQILAAPIHGISLWRVSDGALLAKLDNPYASSRKLIFSPDGTFLVGLGKGSITVWGIPQPPH